MSRGIDYSFLENAVPKQQEPGPVNTSDMVGVTIRVDADALVQCDGEFVEELQLKAGIPTKAKFPIGQHLLEFISEKFTDIKVEKVVEWPEAGKNYLCIINDLKAPVAQKAAQLEQQRQAEEVEKKRKAEEVARKKAEEEAEKKRKAEEAARKKAQEERIKKMTPSQKFKEGQKILEEDYDWGLEVIKMASKEGVAEASKFLAFGFADGDNGIEKEDGLALDYFLAFLKQADKNDKDLAKVNYKLGYSYQYGKFGAPEDFKRSVKYYEQAVKLGDVPSLCKLAFGYDFGKGCFKKDEAKALKYYLEFAAKGDETYDDYKTTLYNLGSIYYYGLNGAEKDQQKAISYYKKSAELGYKDAKERLKKFEETEKKRLQEIADKEREEAVQKKMRRKRNIKWSIFSLLYFNIALFGMILDENESVLLYSILYLCIYWVNHWRFKEEKYESKRVSYLVPLLPVTLTTLSYIEWSDLSSTWGWLVFFVISLIIIFIQATINDNLLSKIAVVKGTIAGKYARYAKRNH